MCKVSVIVPVYNTEKYLRACLMSLASQTLDDIEIIVVNDGSTDGSLVIAEEFVAKYSWFKVCSTENKGVSHARNYGAEISHGDYLAFVDSDDEVEPDYCKAMYEKAIKDKNDVVFCRADKIVNRHGTVATITHPQTFWEEDNFKFADYPYLLNRLSTGIWNKLIKRQLFMQIKFPVDIRAGEDYQVVIKAFCLAENIGNVKRILYHHYHTHFGVTSYFGEQRLDWVRGMTQLLRFLKEHNLYDLFGEEFECFAAINCINLYKQALEKDDVRWPIRHQFIVITKDFMNEQFPKWMENPCYMVKLRIAAKQWRPAFYNYTEKHLLFLIDLSRMLPCWLYMCVLGVDYILVCFYRRLRWR